MKKEYCVEKIREFNRFYMPSMNLLGNHYLGSEYSVTEARIFFEIYEHEGCNAASIARNMNIDKSYLSRIIRNHEKNGYIQRKSSDTDARSNLLFLTSNGKRRAEKLISDSNSEIEKIIKNLTKEEEKDLIKAIDIIIKLLDKGESGGHNEN